MADLEKLTVLLEAQTKQFDSAMKRVARLTDDTANKATRSLGRLDKALAKTNAATSSFMKNFALGAIGGLGFERLASSINEAVKQMADLADEAKRAGTSAEDLQAIGFAAMQAGSSTEEMVDLMKKFNVLVGEASTKSNDLAKLFEANGIALRNQDGTLRSTKDLFYEMSNLIANAANHQEAAKIAAIGFGKAAGDALPFLQQGAEAIKQGEQAARDVGAVISNELIAKADEFDDRWAAKWAAFSGHAKSALVETLTAIESWNDAAVKAVSGFFGTTPANMFPAGASGNITQFDLMMQSAKRPAGQTTVMPQLGGSSGTPKKAAEEIIDLTNAGADYIAVAQKMSEQVMAVEDAFVGFFTSLANGTKPIDALRNALSQLGGSLLKLGLTKGFEILVGALAGGGGFANSGLGSSIQMGGLYAAGGAIKGNTANIVGENGPELFVPGSSGYVVPNSRMGGMGGAAPVINVINQGGIQSSQTTSRRDGRDVVEIVNRVVESTFGTNLQKHASLIGARPMSRRTS